MDNNNNNERNIIFIASEKDHGGTFFQNIFRVRKNMFLVLAFFGRMMIDDESW